MIAFRQLEPAQIQLADNAVGQRVAIVIENVAGVARQRLSNAVRVACAALLVDVEGAADRVFCRPVAVHELDAGISADDRGRGAVASYEHGLQA